MREWRWGLACLVVVFPATTAPIVILNELLAEFEGADPADALQMLIEFGDELPPVSAARQGAPLPAQCRVLECQTPVYLWVDVDRGAIRLEADVPEQSPTVRGFVALLVQGLKGATLPEIARLPDDFLPLLGLESTLGMTRRQGFRGIVSRIKRAAAGQFGGTVAPQAG
ncbi:MAG: SufE family protein [Planctomycetaceae bacterium]